MLRRKWPVRIVRLILSDTLNAVTACEKEHGTSRIHPSEKDVSWILVALYGSRADYFGVCFCMQGWRDDNRVKGKR